MGDDLLSVFSSLSTTAAEVPPAPDRQDPVPQGDWMSAMRPPWREEEINKKMEDARKHYSDYRENRSLAEAGLEFVAKNSLPWASAVLNRSLSEGQQKALDRVKAGIGNADDYKIAASTEYEQNRLTAQSTGRAVLEGLGAAPAFVGEAITGGAVAGRALRGVGLLGRPAATIAGRAVQGAGMQAAAASTVVSGWLAQSQQRAEREGGNWYDSKNAAPELVRNALTNAILGQTAAAVGKVPGGLAGRTAAAGAIMPLEMQGADALMSAADVALKKAGWDDRFKFDTRWGTLGAFAEGKNGEGWKKLATEAFLGAAFSAFHGQPVDLPGKLAKTADALGKAGLTPEAAGKVIEESLSRPAESLPDGKLKDLVEATQKVDTVGKPDPFEGVSDSDVADLAKTLGLSKKALRERAEEPGIKGLLDAARRNKRDLPAPVDEPSQKPSEGEIAPPAKAGEAGVDVRAMFPEAFGGEKAPTEAPTGRGMTLGKVTPVTMDNARVGVEVGHVGKLEQLARVEITGPDGRRVGEMTVGIDPERPNVVQVPVMAKDGLKFGEGAGEAPFGPGEVRKLGRHLAEMFPNADKVAFTVAAPSAEASSVRPDTPRANKAGKTIELKLPGRASREAKKPEGLLDVRKVFEEQGNDLAKTGAAVGERVKAHLDTGGEVTAFFEGKAVPIIAVKDGMMQDARGQRWGVMALIMPTPGVKAGIEFQPAGKKTEAKAPEVKSADQSLPAPPPDETLSRGGYPGNLGQQGRPPKERAMAREKVTEERAERGLEPVLKEAARSNPEGWSQAQEAMRRNPNAGEDLVNRLEVEPRIFADADVPLLLLHRVALSNAHRNAVVELNRMEGMRIPDGKGEWKKQFSDAELEPFRRAVEEAEAARSRMDVVTDRVGAQLGRGLQFYRQLAREDYSLSSMLASAEAAARRPLTADERTRIEELSRKIDELEAELERLRAGGKPGSGGDETDVKIDRDKVIGDYVEWKRKWERARRPRLQKIGEGVLETGSAMRMLLTAYDMSATLLQGGLHAAGNPIKGLRAFRKSIGALMSERQALRQFEMIKKRKNFNLYEKSGGYLSTADKPEESFAGRWITMIPGVKPAARAYNSMLNHLRMDVFDSLVKSPEGRSVTPEEAAAAANLTNVFTGRGSTPKALEKSLDVAAHVLFAPRHAISRFQTVVGQPLYGGKVTVKEKVTMPDGKTKVISRQVPVFGGSNRMRGRIAAQYGRSILGLATVYGIYSVLFPDRKLSFDPRSADAGKIVLGNTRIDPTSGLSQATVFLARMLTGEFKGQDGRVSDLRGKVFGLRSKLGKGGSDMGDVAGRYFRNKLAPAPGQLATVGLGTRPGSGKAFKSQRELGLFMLGQLLPINPREIIEAAMKEGVPETIAIAIASTLGHSTQTYDRR